jgi:hypothetical protein
MAVSMPLYATVKSNIKTFLEAVADEEKTISAGRNFAVTKDRWRPWIEKEQNIALVNIMVDGIEPVANRSAAKTYMLMKTTFNLDMYVMGTAEEQGIYDEEDELIGVSVLPADEKAQERLDLLIMQVLHGIMRLKNADFGLAPGKIEPSISPSLQMYSQEAEATYGQYAPARWTFDLNLPYYPADDAALVKITEINVAFEQALETWSLKYKYPSI